MNIYIMRHGETAGNEKGIFQGWYDSDLNQSGIELAEETGRGMKGIRFDKAFSSSLIRAYHTAQLVLENSGNSDVEIIQDDRLKEIGVGIYEGKVFRGENAEVPKDIYNGFFEDPFHFPGWEGGETIEQLLERTQSFLQWLITQDYENVLVATHGCTMRALLNSVYENPQDYWHGHVPYNCAVNIVHVDGNGMKLIADDKIYYDPAKCIDRFAPRK